MASDLNTPNGQAVITPKNGPAFVEALEVKKFHGVGPAMPAKMERLGLLTGADLKAKSLDFLQANFGKSGGWYYRISRGIDERPVQPGRPRKSVGAEDTFMVDIFDLEAARSELVPLAEKVWRHCEPKGLSGRTLTLKVKFADFQQITRSRTFLATTPIYSSAEIALLCSASDPGQIDEMIEGRRKVPLGMVKALAAALDCSERELMAMALRDWYGDEVSDQIAQCFRADARDTAENAWIAALRDLHDGVVPELTTNRLRRLQLLSRFSG